VFGAFGDGLELGGGVVGGAKLGVGEDVVLAGFLGETDAALAENGAVDLAVQNHLFELAGGLVVARQVVVAPALFVGRIAKDGGFLVGRGLHIGVEGLVDVAVLLGADLEIVLTEGQPGV